MEEHNAAIIIDPESRLITEQQTGEPVLVCLVLDWHHCAHTTEFGTCAQAQSWRFGYIQGRALHATSYIYNIGRNAP